MAILKCLGISLVVLFSIFVLCLFFILLYELGGWILIQIDFDKIFMFIFQRKKYKVKKLKEDEVCDDYEGR